MEDYIDLLLVETGDKKPELVAAPAHEAPLGAVVFFDGGRCGTVVKKAWMDAAGDAFDVISDVAPVFRAEAVYTCRWRKEAGDAEDT